MVEVQIRKNAYYDSVSLMLISKEVKKLPGVEEALVGMGTELNKEISRNIGLDTGELEALTANDFFFAVRGETQAALAEAVAKVEALLNAKKQTDAAAYCPPTLDSALKMEPGLNLAVISVPGQHAAGLARQCLEKNIHVMMFSDNVSIADEKKLKELAAEKGLLMMGPDCGTAIINHTPLAFANVVAGGDIGIVAASGTGAQEVSTQIDHHGGGISQLLATGGRDLKEEIGGLMFHMTLDALIADPATKVLVLISKPPAKAVQTKILQRAKQGGKPTVVCFIGGDPGEAEAYGLVGAASLEDAARKAVALSQGEAVPPWAGLAMPQAERQGLLAAEAGGYSPGQRYLRGLYTGGTLCDEAMKLLAPQLGAIHSNVPLRPEDALADPKQSQAHSCLDFGDDAFTLGRPHPMIDPSLREERLLQEAADPEVAVILLDCVLGYGSHKDPAGSLAEAVAAAREMAREAGRRLSCVVSVCGTEADPQCLSASQQALRQAGALVLPSNAQAALLAGLLLAEAEQRRRDA